MPIRYVIKSVTGSAPDAAALNGRALAAATGESTVRRVDEATAADRDASAGAGRVTAATLATLVAVRALAVDPASFTVPVSRGG
ncbi:MAG: hypothetical protein NT156_00155 [Mycobacterium sp.]|nr:hypothetical protein [Mycobacterium sp.]